ncbi:MAG TPA: response regulator [Ramlibacter sp.]|nr:response regulator [Ramlibacter sp.]
MPGAPPLVAIVDDDESIREATANLLQSVGWSTATFEDAMSFLRSPQRGSAACVVADVRMPGLTGLEMYEELVASGEAIPTVLITAYPDDSVRARASDAGIVCCLGKPFAPEQLLHCVREALAKSRRGHTS